MKIKSRILIFCSVFLLLASIGAGVYAEDTEAFYEKQEVTQGGIVLKNAEYPIDTYEGVANTGMTNVIKNGLLGLGNTLFWVSKLIYQGFDIGLSNLSSTDILDTQLDKITTASNSLWAKVSENYVPILLIVVGMIFIYVFAVKGGVSEAFGMLFRVIGVFIIASIWIGNAGYFVKVINNLSEEMQGHVLSIAGTFSNDIAEIPSGEQVAGTTALMRNTYFNATVYRSYLVMNYGTTDEESLLREDDNRIDNILEVKKNSKGEQELKNRVSDEATKMNNEYMDKDGVGVYAKLGIGIVSLFLVVLLGIPFLLMALVNLLVQILILAIVLLLPLSFAVSLLPKFAESGMKLLGKLAVQFVYKAMITFFLMFALLIIQVVDSIFPPMGVGGYLINTVVLIILLNLMVLKRNEIITMVTAGYVGIPDGNKGASRASQSVRHAAGGAARGLGRQMKEANRAEERRDARAGASNYKPGQSARPTSSRDGVNAMELSKQREMPTASSTAQATKNQEGQTESSDMRTQGRSNQREMPKSTSEDRQSENKPLTSRTENRLPRSSQRDLPQSAGKETDRFEPSQNPRDKDNQPARSSQREMPKPPRETSSRKEENPNLSKQRQLPTQPPETKGNQEEV